MPILGKKPAKDVAAKKPLAKPHSSRPDALKHPITLDDCTSSFADDYGGWPIRVWASRPRASSDDGLPGRWDANQEADCEAEAAAHRAVDEVKQALGERGPVWWRDGSADINRHMAKTKPYAESYANIGQSSPRGM